MIPMIRKFSLLFLLPVIFVMFGVCKNDSPTTTVIPPPKADTVGIWAGIFLGDTASMQGVIMDHRFIYTFLNDSSYNALDSILVTNRATHYTAFMPMFAEAGRWINTGATFILTPDSCMGLNGLANKSNCGTGSTTVNVSADTLIFNSYGDFGTMKMTKIR
jgi:hypothetical protein